MLSFAEEIYLLALDEDTGKVMSDARDPVLETVLIGAVLTELTFLKKISTDKEHLYILDTTRTKSQILNDILEILRESHEKSARIDQVLLALMSHAKRIEKLVLAELLKKGILAEVDKKILWIFPDRRYPLIDDKEIANVEIRIRNLVLSNDKPDPKDIALVSLLHASNLFSKILFLNELNSCEKRIVQLSKMCDIGEKIEELIYKIRDLPDSPYPECLTEEDTIE
ncbi:MAG: GPP34 family phosphoprotein [Victivallaceae bacterium]|nr:GPP34 family phosphoprotein [Victivallaceae bacterium]